LVATSGADTGGSLGQGAAVLTGPEAVLVVEIMPEQAGGAQVRPRVLARTHWIVVVLPH
jgi:hypothetical protein